jgi:uncharacterized membrane protein AbrB (regulator of aidB expression)
MTLHATGAVSALPGAAAAVVSLVSAANSGPRLVSCTDGLCPKP